MISAFSNAQEVWIDGVEYTMSGDTAAITDCNSHFNGVLNVDSISYNEKKYPVTSVGDQAFKYCYDLTTVSLPLVTSIGSEAFLNCYDLTSVNLPLVTSIGSEAFLYCDALTSVNLPTTAPCIEENSFANKRNINIFTPSIEASSYTADKGYDGFQSIGYYYDKDREFIYSISNSDNNNKATILAAKDIIKPYINRINIKEVIFEESIYPITKVATSAFQDCEALTSVSLPLVTSIGSRAFSNCPLLINVDLQSVLNIESSAFSGCRSLKSISLPTVAPNVGNHIVDNEYKVNIFTPGIKNTGYIGNDSFLGFASIGYYYENDKEFTYSISSKNDSLQATILGVKNFQKTNIKIIDKKELLFDGILIPITSVAGSAFYYCQSLISVSLPLVTHIGHYAFIGCESLSSLDLPLLKIIGKRSFAGCDALINVSLPSIYSVCDFGFQDCKNLTDIKLPLVTDIGYSAFTDCVSLTSASLPSVANIEPYAFSRCFRLTTVNFPLVANVKIGAFQYCNDLTSVSLPSVVSIGSNVFYHCDALTNVSLPIVAPSIQNNTFDDSRSNISIVLPKGHIGYTVENGWTGFKNLGSLSLEIGNINYDIDNESSTATIVGIKDKSLTETTINNTIRNGDNTYNVVFHQENFIFAECNNLRKITMPAKALPLSFYTFYGVDKSQISIYVDASREEASGYTVENGYDGFKEIIFKGDTTGITPNEVYNVSAFVDEYGKLHINGIDHKKEVSIYDSMGSLIYKSNSENLDIELRSGIYFVRVGSKTIKVVAK